MLQQPLDKFEKHLQKAKLKPFKRYFTPDVKILDIGCGDGSVFTGTEYKNVYGHDTLNVGKYIESSPNYIKFYSNLKEINIKSFDVICLMGVLEHVKEPKEFLEQFKEAKNIYITVPNARSFHRWVGLELGIINNLHDLKEADLEIGHQSYFSPTSLQGLLEPYCIKNRFVAEDYGTIGFKITSNIGMKVHLDIIDQVELVAEHRGIIGKNRELGAEIYCYLKSKDV